MCYLAVKIWKQLARAIWRSNFGTMSTVRVVMLYKFGSPYHVLSGGQTLKP